MVKAAAPAATSADLYAKPGPNEEYIPSWVVFDKQVLKFDGFFKEAVHDSTLETYRVRRINVLFYLEDDSVSVMEPRTKNSGMQQGTLIRRHRVQKEDSAQYFTVKDFAVGSDITMYGRTFHIVDCDQFTRNFYERLGIAQGAQEEAPVDQHAEWLERQQPIVQRATATPNSVFGVKSLTSGGLSSPGRVKRDPLLQFLQNDRKVLRYFCMWEDGLDKRKFTLHYFLADDTIEILERVPPNSGRDPFPTFMKRQVLPKGFCGIKELKIGTAVVIHNRSFFIYDVDAFTKQFYEEHYAMSDEDFAPIDVDDKAKALPRRPIADYNGFGSEEDSLSACLSLDPKPPKRDLAKRAQLEGVVMRFSGKFSDKTQDQTRTFGITFFLGDDTVMVTEQQSRNSGFPGGKFFERARAKNPVKVAKARACASPPAGGPRRAAAAAAAAATCTTVEQQLRVQEEAFYHASDFYLGAQVSINSFIFTLLDAADYTICYMEAHPREWPQSDVSTVLDKLASVVEATKVDIAQLMAPAAKDGTVSLEDFSSIMNKADFDLTLQEMRTLQRSLDVNDDGRVHFPFLQKFLYKDTTADA
eukprot:TRINITY_DN4177_c0_g3_i1.p1 TRINITY_DN4177_c0_g3~~TRINITY_DN4177_c0_g3_i1.p1  ORF type:complete len:642 (-),score=187.91 TRINITY_DN4177_c0_g3_i1:78-1832(-)